MKPVIRQYRDEDRPGLRHVCCETGFMGDPVDRLFSDRELFADFFTSYYTDKEPEYSLVADSCGEVVGYIICCTRQRSYSFHQIQVLLKAIPKILGSLADGSCPASDRRFIKWFLARSMQETPRAPRRAAHFHINLLPEHRNTGTGIRLFKHFIAALEDADIKKLYGQIQTFEGRRTDKVFERFGFQLYDRRAISKFKEYGVENVYVSTFARSL
jgi:GNAT superfamily N-acetyltransferase